MSARSEDDIILKLILKGQTESDIIDHLKKHNMVDEISIYRIQSKIREMKSAQAFLPHTPSFFDRFSRVLLGVFLLMAGGLLAAWSAGLTSLNDNYVHWSSGLYGGIFVAVVGILYLVKGFSRSRWD